MASKKTGLKSAKRFGARYGPRSKLKLALIEAEQHKLQECPGCGRAKAKWKSYGIWECSKCKTKFTSRAYTVRSALALAKEEVKQLTAEEIMAVRAAKAEEEEE